MNTEPTSIYHQFICTLVVDIAAGIASNLIQTFATQLTQAAGWC